MLRVNPVAQKTKERIAKASPVLSYAVFLDFAKKTMDKIPQIIDAATIKAETVNKKAIQCDTSASNIFVRNSVLKFIKIPKGIFMKLKIKEKMLKSKDLFSLTHLRKESEGACEFVSWKFEGKEFVLNSIFMFQIL